MFACIVLNPRPPFRNQPGMRLLIKIPTVFYFCTAVEHQLPKYRACALAMIERAVYYVRMTRIDAGLLFGKQVVCVYSGWFCDVNGGAALAIQICFAAHRKISVDVDEYYRNEVGGVTLCVIHSHVRGRVVPGRVTCILNRGGGKSEA